MKKKKTTIPGIIKWVIALILVVMQVYPFFYVFTSSFKSLDDFRQLPAYALPSKWVLTNFINVFTKSHMLTYFKNSIIVLIGVLIPLLLFALMAGFALSKIKFKGRKFVLNYFLLGLMLPMQVALIPLFTIFNKMGLINTYPAIILPQIAFSLSYSIQLFYSFSKFFPEEMLEAAGGFKDGEEPEKILVASASIHGHTRAAAHTMAEKLRAQGAKVVEMDLTRTDVSYAVTEAFRCGKIVLACATYDGFLFPPMENLLTHLKTKNFQNRTVGLMENGTWAPMAAKLMRAELESMKNITLCENVVTIRSAANAAAEAQMDALAAELVAK